MSRTKKATYDITWLLENTAEDCIGKTHYNELEERYCETQGKKPKVQHLGKIIAKLYPSVKVSQEMHLGKKVTTYKGIYMLPQKKRLPEIDWTDIFGMLPSTVMLLSDRLSKTINFSMKSNVLSNGNVILKDVSLVKDSRTWSLKVRGKRVNLEEFGINPSFSMTAKSVNDILRTVEMLQVCTGKTVSKNDEKHTHATIERVSLLGNENSDSNMVRSNTCRQVTNVGCTGSRVYSTELACRACQENVSKLSVKKLVSDNAVASTSISNESSELISVPQSEEQISVQQSEDGSTIDLNEEDHNDLMTVLENIFPDAPENMKLLLKSQHDALTVKSKHARQWDLKIIGVCLSLWVRSRKNYKTLSESGMLILPSGRQLQRYKNVVPQGAGINEKVLEWMFEAAKDAKIPELGWSGGLHHDETKIQSDLVIDMTNGVPSLIGWVDLGEEATFLRMLRYKEVQQQLAHEVIHLSFLGYTGFRFPICHFPTSGIKASELHIIVWKTIAKLKDWGFSVDYIMQDGGSENRSCTNLHFEKNACDGHYGSPSLINQSEMVYHVQDYSHNVKKLRNSILKSATVKDDSHTRHLFLHGKSVLWVHWVKAVQWDWEVNSRRIHFRVTESHLHPNISEKMRNELAETMLNADMLNLMKCYKESLFDGSYLDSIIELLEITSSLIKIFHSKTLITSMSDDRFKAIDKAREFFRGWRTEVEGVNASKAEKQRMLPSAQCLDDMDNLLVTFPKVCDKHLMQFSGSSIKPSRFNNDIAENIFCQQKGVYNGNNSNPTYYSYSKSVNSILLGQSLKSRGRKSNAGLESVKSFSEYTSKRVIETLKHSPSKCIRV